MGGDPSIIAQNIIAWYGSGAGGRFFLVALLIITALAAFHILSPRAPVMVLLMGGLSWGAAFALRSWMGWAV